MEAKLGFGLAQEKWMRAFPMGTGGYVSLGKDCRAWVRVEWGRRPF